MDPETTTPPAPRPPTAPTASGSSFASSLGASLAVHGAVVATLALSFRALSAPVDVGRGQVFESALQAAATPPPPPPVEEEKVVEAERTSEEPTVPEFELPRSHEPDLFPAAPAPAPAPNGTSLFETVVYPRIDLLPAEEETPQSEAVAEPPAVEPAPPAPPEEPPASAAVEASPRPLDGECPPPAYPRVAERRGWAGTVTLLIDVAADGRVEDVRIESSSGHGVLDEAAVSAVRRWRFVPATRDGAPTPATVRKPIRFGRR